MTTTEKRSITVSATIHAPVEKVWKCWTDPAHITRWNSASDDWHTPRAENDLRTGGKFLSRMEARDGSVGFDFEGIYDTVKTNERIEYTMSDGRRVSIDFKGGENTTTVTETFDPENTNPHDMQKAGWQAILDNFKKYVEESQLHFEIEINAPVEKVYNTMLGKETYEAWTSVFNAGSRYEGSWEKGTKILFIGVGEDGNTGGMVSRIKENIPNRFVSIEHLGMLTNGQEIMSGPEVESWAGVQENYTFTENNGKTLLSIDMESNDEFRSYFIETWPKALEKLKSICEN